MSLNYLCDVAEATRYMQGRGYDANTTANLEENIKLFIASAHRRISEYLGYNILSTVYTDEMYDPSETHLLYLFNRPITILTSVKFDGVIQTVSNFSIYQNRALYYEDGFFHEISKVTYTAGYTRATMPADIKHTALRLIYLYAAESGPKGSLGLSSFTQPEGSGSTYDTEAENRILSMLSTYRSWAKC